MHLESTSSIFEIKLNILYSLEKVNCLLQMRYCQEIENILRISQEYDNNTKYLHDVLSNLNWEGNWESNDLASLGHKLTQLAALARLRNEATKFILNCYQHGKVYSEVCKKHSGIPDKTPPAGFEENICTQLTESYIQYDIYNVRIKQLKEEVKATLIACGHCDLSDFLPYLEAGNQDQIVVLQLMLQWVYPNGKSCCNKNPVGSVSSLKITDSQNTPIKSPITSCDSTVLDTGIPKSDSTKMDLEVQDTTQNPMPMRVIETEATTELPNMSLDFKVIETEAPKDDMITVDLKTQDTQLDPKQTPMPKKIIETEAPKNDMVTVDLNSQDTQLNPKPYPIPRKTMTPRHKFKRIKKNGKVQKIQSPGVHKMKFKPFHKNKRVYWSKQLCHVNNLIHDSNLFALYNLYHMVTPNISGLYTTIYPQNMWLLKRPRVKIK